MCDNPAFRPDPDDGDTPPPTYTSRRKSVYPAPPRVILNDINEDAITDVKFDDDDDDEQQHPGMSHADK